MNPGKVSRLKEIVVAASALPEEERLEFVEQACRGDEELLREARSLVSQQGRTAGVVRTGALERKMERAMKGGGPAPDGSNGRRRAPGRIGPFRILEVLGEGGMGTVYRAEQAEPIRREVALKVIRAGMDSAGILARFESERQTLARMDHPGIARVLDAGADEQGRPWFAMELIRGVPLTEHCRAQRLEPRERIVLFLQVCRAVRSAHQRGIIHRDLKPSNILVAMVQGRAVPKVIDFSIAKALAEPGLATEHRTRTGQVIGTLEYMSPEQARGAVGEVDTRSDVYALGVMLHELMSGRLPIDVADVPLHEAVRRIVEEPPEPLRRTRAGTAPGTPADPDVATIAGKCLEKDPDRRYGSAAELAEDLERYLDSRPLLARPPSTFYQLRKLVGRHRVAAGTLALTFVFLVIFGATVSVQLGIQRRERARAEAESRRAEAQTEVARSEAERARRTLAWMQDLIMMARHEFGGPEMTIRELVEEAHRRYREDPVEDPVLQAAIGHTLAVTYGGMGGRENGLELLKEALALREEHLGPEHPDTAATVRAIGDGMWLQSRDPGAIEYVRRALEIHRAQEDPDEVAIAQSLNSYAFMCAEVGRLEDARQAYEESLALRRGWPPGRDAEISAATVKGNLAVLLYRQGELKKAAGMARESMEVKCTLAKQEQDPGCSRSLQNLSMILFRQGEFGEAESLGRRAMDMEAGMFGKDSQRVAYARCILGEGLLAAGRPGEAGQELSRSVGRLETAMGPGSALTAMCRGFLARALLRLQRPEEAAEQAGRAYRDLASGHGPRNRRALLARDAMARALAATGRVDEAEAEFQACLKIGAQALGEDHPDLALIRQGYAALLVEEERPGEASAAVSAALAVQREKLGETHPETRNSRELHARVQEALARLDDGRSVSG